jgi:membrane-bound metal-dependent hydrolase YbcI (DUF457 family)
MRGSEHVAFAALTTGLGLYALNHGRIDLSVPAIAAVSVAAIASLVPDIDHPRAWISNRIPATLIAGGLAALLGYWIMQLTTPKSGRPAISTALAKPLLEASRPLLGWAWLAVAMGAALLLIGMIVANSVEHRGETHSLTVGASLSLIALIGFAIAGQPATLGLWFGWGYLSHLLTDSMTNTGCPALLWPWNGGGRATLRTAKPAFQPMTRPGAQETGTPSPTTSAVANGDGELAQPVEDLQSHMTTGFAKDVLAPSDLEAGQQSES